MGDNRSSAPADHWMTSSLNQIDSKEGRGGDKEKEFRWCQVELRGFGDHKNGSTQWLLKKLL